MAKIREWMQNKRTIEDHGREIDSSKYTRWKHTKNRRKLCRIQKNNFIIRIMGEKYWKKTGRKTIHTLKSNDQNKWGNSTVANIKKDSMEKISKK